MQQGQPLSMRMHAQCSDYCRRLRHRPVQRSRLDFSHNTPTVTSQGRPVAAHIRGDAPHDDASPSPSKEELILKMLTEELSRFWPAVKEAISHNNVWSLLDHYLKQSSASLKQLSSLTPVTHEKFVQGDGRPKLPQSIVNYLLVQERQSGTDADQKWHVNAFSIVQQLENLWKTMEVRAILSVADQKWHVNALSIVEQLEEVWKTMEGRAILSGGFSV